MRLLRARRHSRPDTRAWRPPTRDRADERAGRLAGRAAQRDRRTASPAAALVGERQRLAAVPGEFRDLLYRDDDVPALRSAEPGPHIHSPFMGRQPDLRVYSHGGVGIPLCESPPGMT